MFTEVWETPTGTLLTAVEGALGRDEIIFSFLFLPFSLPPFTISFSFFHALGLPSS